MINPATLLAVAGSLTEVERAALANLDNYYGRGPRHIARDANISENEARKILQHFRREGICDFGPLVSEDDGLMRGRGYWLDRFGQAVRAEAFKVCVVCDGGPGNDCACNCGMQKWDNA